MRKAPQRRLSSLSRFLLGKTMARIEREMGYLWWRYDGNPVLEHKMTFEDFVIAEGTDGRLAGYYAEADQYAGQLLSGK